MEGKRNGHLFARQNRSKASLGDHDPMFRSYLARAKAKYPKRFSEAVAINDFSLRRSLGRGATTEAQNNQVDPVAIELINRWRKKEAVKGAESTGLIMLQVYTQVLRAVVAELRISQSN